MTAHRSTRRRPFILVALAFTLVVFMAMPAWPASGPEGSLRSAFESYFAGGAGNFYATVVAGGQGYLHAANGVIDFGTGAERINPVTDGTYCDSNVFGIWVFVTDTSRAGAEAVTWNIWFGPEGGPSSQLPNTSSAAKKFVDPQGVFVGEPLWWRSIGVPVYGTLAPGRYAIHSESSFGEFDVTATVADC